MSFRVEGDYFETCSCDVSCPCIWLGPATQENCDVMLAWHIDEGSSDGVDLAGLNAVLAVHAPKRMTDGGWRVALYLDDRADEAQASALGAIFSGAAGGHLAALSPLIGEVAGVAPAPITYSRDGSRASASVAGTLTMSAEEITGMDGSGPALIENAPMGVVAQPVRQGHAGDVAYHGHWDVQFSGTNSFLTAFRYEG